MPHRTSAAALHAARTVLRNYTLTVKSPDAFTTGRVPNMRSDESCVAVVIDYATNVFHIAALRPELRHWQEHLRAGTAKASQIAAFMDKMYDAFMTIPRENPKETQTTTLETPREFGGPPMVLKLSKPSMEASRFIFYYFIVVPRKGQCDEIIDRVKVAQLVEVSLGLSRATDGALARLTEERARLKRGDATAGEISKCLRQIGIALEYMPNYENREEELKLL